jgi:hypothetical protein
MKPLIISICLIISTSSLSFAQMFAKSIEGHYSINYKLNQINRYLAEDEPDLKGELLYHRLEKEGLFIFKDSLLISLTASTKEQLDLIDLMNKKGASIKQVLREQIYYAGFVQIDSLLQFPFLFTDIDLRLNLEHRYEEGDNQGPGLINSASYETGGNNLNAGSGITIAILDAGWGHYFLARDNGYAPEDFIYYNCSSGTCIETTIPGGQITCPGDSPFCAGHGNMSVQTVFHHAPAATYLIYNVSGNVNRAAAIQHAAGHGANIITCSQSSYNTGWNDNTGIICNAINAAPGVLMFFSAGNRNGNENRNGEHWQGFFNDDGNGTHIWGDNNIQNNWIGPNSIINEGSSFSVNIQCDNDNGGNTDRYEIQIINSGTNDVLSVCRFSQNTLCSWMNSTGNPVNVGIRLIALTSLRPEFELWTHCGCIRGYQYFSSNNQTTSPANCNHPRVLTVAAVDKNHYNWSSPSAMASSSSGPTNDNNSSIGLTGPTNTYVAKYNAGGDEEISAYGGTSCATPNVAGAAAAFWSKNLNLNADHIRNILVDKAQIFKDWGPTGYDDRFGYGGAYLCDYNFNNAYMDQDNGEQGQFPQDCSQFWHSLKDLNTMYPKDHHLNVQMLTDDLECAPCVLNRKMTIFSTGNPGSFKKIE